MKYLPHSFLLYACMLFMSVQAYAGSLFGFAPLDPDTTALMAQGSGKNGYAEAAITLDPASNPAVAALKGAKIIGVRCYMNSNYRQKNKRTSAINIRQGSIQSEPVKNYANFSRGWNEISLDDPVTIGDEAIHIGPMVYETSGNPYPFVAVPGPAFPGGYSISLDNSPWIALSERGNLLMQVLIDRQPEEMPAAAMAAVGDLPLVVAPESELPCSLSIHNFSAQEISSVTVTTVTDNGQTILDSTMDLPYPVAPFDTYVFSTALSTGFLESPETLYSISVSAINGKPTDLRPESSFYLHVTHDAFLRIPLIEEFTSQRCTNCPFMAYYLDIALEQFTAPYVYLSRHSGFLSDFFTVPEDEELTYLFNGYTFNPAVMYDRTVFDEAKATPVVAAKESSSAPYTEAINKAASIPALARILVDSEIAADKASCRVYGRIADDIPADGLFLCAYMIENGIPAEGMYFQQGLDDAPDDAPDDLLDRFRHNGIIRASFHKTILGDPLEVDPDSREFDVRLPDTDVNADWKLENCEIVAFICRVDKDNIRENYILNAGGSRWNEAVGVKQVSDDSSMPQISISPDRKISAHGCRSIEVFTLSGMKTDSSASLDPGIYIVRTISASGIVRSTKIAVRQ